MSEANEGTKADRRSSDRAQLQMPISLRRRGAHAEPASLDNISPIGCLVRGISLAKKDELIWVRVPGLESQQAKVCWSERFDCGLEFVSPLHHAVVNRLCNDNAPAHHPAAGARPELAETSGTRREKIMRGEFFRQGVLSRKEPKTSGSAMSGLIRRTARRTVDHRRETRFPPPDAEVTLKVDGAIAEVADLSRSGLRVACAQPKGLGDRVSVEFVGCEPFDGLIVWKREDLMGLALPPDSIELRAE